MSRAASDLVLRPAGRAGVGRRLRRAAWAAVVVTAGLFAVTPFLATSWAQRPFLGFFLEPRLLVSGAGDPAQAEGSARPLIPSGHQLIAAAGQPVASDQELGAQLAGQPPGATILIQSASAAGQVRTDAITLGRLPTIGLAAYFWLPYLLGAIILSLGGCVLLRRADEPAAQALALACALIALAGGVWFDTATTHLLPWAWTLASANIGAAAVALAGTFPRPTAAAARRPLLPLAGFLPGLLLAGYGLYGLYGAADPRAYRAAWQLGYAGASAGLLALIGVVLWRWRAAASPLVRAQCRLALVGAGLAFTPLLAAAAAAGGAPGSLILALAPAALIFPAAIAGALLCDRLGQADALLSHGLSYAAIARAERRARDWARLNQACLAMAATLDLGPLPERILRSAVDLLGCEAGSLDLADPESGAAGRHAAIGPNVGQGSICGATITAPLLAAGRRIGTLALGGKRDGSPFDDDDQGLLAALADQAALAIENARRYSRTEQALAARIEELAEVQRISRELNTTLDTVRVAAISLGWALKCTGAAAGWVGLAGEAGLEVAACQGYGPAEARLRAGPLPLAGGLAGRVLASGQAVRVSGARADLGDDRLRDSTRAVLAAPVTGPGRAAGLLVLESDRPDDFGDGQAAFVDRLLDLTGIALTNARLYAEVHSANAAKSEYVSFVAHELKTPMTSIKGYADLLLGGAVGAVNELQAEFLGIIRGNIERMNTLVSDLSDVARLESGRLRLELKPLPFLAILEDVARSAQALIDAQGQSLAVEAPADLPAVQADYERTVQVLANLVSNAHKYTPAGGRIVVRAEPAANQWDPHGPPAVLHVSVADNGIGIAPQDLGRLFEKFFRADDRRAREMAPGTGLGLNIVKNLVELQGGRVWAESERGRGSTFHFTLPLARQA